MNELTPTYAIAALVLGTGVFHLVTRRFDPFAPIWLFLVGIFQLYVVQAISYHDWAVRVRGQDVVAGANLQALWGVAWMLAVYLLGPGRLLARILPEPPRRWSRTAVAAWSPVLFVWGLICAVLVVRGADAVGGLSAEQNLLASFPMVLLVSGILLIVTGNQPDRPMPIVTAIGVATVVLYLLLWMLNGKRSHSLVAILTGVCAYNVARCRRPSWAVLIATAVAGTLAVGVAINWRFYAAHHKTQGSVSDFAAFVASFDPAMVLSSLNLADAEERPSCETEEYGGYLLMFDTVPFKADYDYGASYLRIFSTYIPRIVWPEKPLFGREQWVNAWIAGSELKRDSTFTGPAIGILGACQLNGGAWGTLIVMGVIGLVLRAGYEYFRLYQDRPWVQLWWALTYYNAWVMTAGDDPLAWFYYNYSFTTLPTLFGLWFLNKALPGPAPLGPAA